MLKTLRRRTRVVDRLNAAYMQVNDDVVGAFWMLHTGSCSSRTVGQRRQTEPGRFAREYRILEGGGTHPPKCSRRGGTGRGIACGKRDGISCRRIALCVGVEETHNPSLSDVSGAG